MVMVAQILPRSTRFRTTWHMAIPVKGDIHYDQNKTRWRIIWSSHSWLKILSHSSRLNTISRRSYIGMLWRHWLACPKKHWNDFWKYAFSRTRTWMRLQRLEIKILRFTSSLTQPLKHLLLPSPWSNSLRNIWNWPAPTVNTEGPQLS